MESEELTCVITEEIGLLTEWLKTWEKEKLIKIRIQEQRRRRGWLEGAVLGFLLGWWMDER